MKLEALLLAFAYLLSKSLVVFFETLKQLNDLRILNSLVDDLLLEFLVLLTQDLHIVFEEVYVLTHASHLLFVLLDALAVLLPISIKLLLQRFNNISLVGSCCSGRLEKGVWP